MKWQEKYSNKRGVVTVATDDATLRVVRAGLRTIITKGPPVPRGDGDYSCTADEARLLLDKIGDGV